jgi:DNA-binding transcriptional ArsR family regulator
MLGRMLHPFAVLADPVRRRIVEVLAVGDHSAGTVCEVVSSEFGVSRTAVSHQLRTLRDNGVAESTIDQLEPRSRSYRLNPEFLARLDDEVGRLYRLFDHRYGTAEGRAPLVEPPRARARRSHRLGAAAQARREADRGAWIGRPQG